MSTEEDISTIELLKEQIKIVAKARVVVRRLKDEKRDLLDRWEQHNKELLYQIDLQSAGLEDEETELRERTLKAYRETGNKAPAPGVGVREITKLEYDAKEAFAWATHHEMALKLDVPVFERIVKTSPISFVRVYQEPQATISQDLGAVPGET
tara:strand:- start:457 stop:915 length:459 start_codon:yes stop_codon:yes gene_type:complete